MNNFNNLTSIDLAYKIGTLISNKKNFKYIDTNSTIKIYHFYKPNLSIVICTINKNKFTLYINGTTDIVELVNFFDEVFKNQNINTISLKEVSLEKLVVDRHENILYTLLTEDNISIDLDEDFFNFIPKDGDILNENLELDSDNTNKKKTSITEKFNKLKK